MGAVIVIAQGIDEIFRWRSRSVILNDTAQGLRDELILHRSRAGSYANSSDPDRLLAEQVVALRGRTTGAYREVFRPTAGPKLPEA